MTGGSEFWRTGPERGALLACRLLAVPSARVPALLAEADQLAAEDPAARVAVAVIGALAHIDRRRPAQVAMFCALVEALVSVNEEDE